MAAIIEIWEIDIKGYKQALSEVKTPQVHTVLDHSPFQNSFLDSHLEFWPDGQPLVIFNLKISY